jgi:capsular polysaccharide biosynthesis protein
MLVPCNPSRTPGRVLPDAPPITVLEDVVYRPLRDPAIDQDTEWGIYDRDGFLLRQAAVMWGPDLHLIGQSPSRPALRPKATADTFVYGGVIFEHFGHFILSSLSRLWPFADPFLRASLEGCPILFHAPSAPGHWFRLGHVAELLGGLELPESRFARFEEPTLIRRLIVPGPSLVEMSHAHPQFARMTQSIGARLDRSPDLGPPVWLSRTELPVGTQGWGNEAALQEVLLRFGVEIVHPERRSLAECVRMFAGRPVMAGTVASAFHAALFCAAPAPMVMLSPSPEVNPSFGMVDAVAGQSARYFYVESDHLGIDMSRRLWSMFMLRNPAGTAMDLLAVLRRSARCGTSAPC